MQEKLIKIVILGTLWFLIGFPVLGQESGAGVINQAAEAGEGESSEDPSLLDEDKTITPDLRIIEEVEEDPFQAIESPLATELEPVATAVQKETAEDISFSRKVGGGLSLFSYFTGLQAYYEFKLHPDLLNTIRGQFIYDFLSTSSGGTNLGINRMFFSGSYRMPLVALKNSYAGVGGGYSQMALNYENSNTGQSYSANGGGLYVLGELGWDKYWAWQEGLQMVLSVGLNLGFYLAYNSNYDETRISNQTNHRDIVNEGWNAAQQIVQLNVGFGSTF